MADALRAATELPCAAAMLSQDKCRRLEAAEAELSVQLHQLRSERPPTQPGPTSSSSSTPLPLDQDPAAGAAREQQYIVEIDRLRQALEEAQSSNKAAATTSQLVTSALSNKITDAAQLQLHLKTLESQLEEAQDEISHKQRLTLQQVQRGLSCWETGLCCGVCSRIALQQRIPGTAT
jgi:hypothetical protein